jgi:Zn-finger nucleic acid-binding protein
VAVTRFRCPECETTLKLARALEPGKRIKCPKCAAVVTVPADEEERVTAARAPVRPRKQRPAQDEQDDEDEEEQEERPRKRRKKPAKRWVSPVLLWSLVGGGVAAVALVVVLILTSSSGRPASGPVAKVGDPPKGGVPPQDGVPPKGDGQQPKVDEKAVLAEQIVGNWQATPESKPYRSVEYRRDGTVTVAMERVRGDGTYQVVSGGAVG